jgi:hypothetical protein
MSSFLTYVKGKDPGSYKTLIGKTIGSSSFDNAWKNLARTKPAEFQKLQHDFIKQSHFTPAANKVKSGIGLDVTRRSTALQNVVWSMSTQHGSGGAYNIFRNAGIKSHMSDADIIKRLYAERSKVDKYFSRSSSGVKRGVYNRFQNELKDALAMLGTSANNKRVGGGAQEA